MASSDADSRPQQLSHADTRLVSKTHRPPFVLRNIQLSDAQAWCDLLNDDANGSDPHAGSSKKFTLDDANGTIPRMRQSAAVPTVLTPDGSRVASGPSRVNLVVEINDNGDGDEASAQGQRKVVGLAGYGAIKDWTRDGKPIRAGDVGVLLDPSQRGKGIGLEAIRMGMAWGFAPISEGGLQLDLVTLTTLEDNARMLRIIDEKLGLKGKGVARPAEFDETKQEMYYEVTPEQWRAMSP